MHIFRIVLDNWLRFAGHHELILHKGAYALRAEWEGATERSNWAGKSSVLEAVAFALYGLHRKRLEDEWITAGAKGGGVLVYLQNAKGEEYCVTRMRERGKPTKVMIAHGGNVLYDEGAQSMIEEVVGISKKDFEMTAWFAQKKMGRLVTMEDSARTELLSRWFGLEDLRMAAKKAKEHLDTTSKALASARASMDGLGPIEDEAVLQQEVSRLDQEMGRLGARADDVAERAQKAQARSFFEAVRKEGIALAEQLSSMTAPSPEERKAAEDAVNRAKEKRWLLQQRVEAAQKVINHGFAGKCPVVPGFECPARERLAPKAKAFGEDEMTACSELMPEANVELREAIDAVSAQTVLVQRISDTKRRLEETRKRGAEYAERMGNGEEAPNPNLAEEVRKVADQMALARVNLRSAREKNERREKIAYDVVNLVREEQIARLAWVGIRTTIREIAMRAVQSIEARANHLLEQAGIAIRVTWTWGRPTKDLVVHCEECGTVFPPTGKVKECATCGAARGYRQQEIDEIVLSDRSGAAEDLAGVFVQFAAAEWLRADRGTEWGVALIDEPFGALDEANRTAFAEYLGVLLRATGYVQAFVVGHHPEISEQFPGEILVVAGPESSSVVTR